LRLLDWFDKLIVGAALSGIGLVLAEWTLDRFTWETNLFTVERNQNPLSSPSDKRLIMLSIARRHTLCRDEESSCLMPFYRETLEYKVHTHMEVPFSSPRR
jgi:hypothetical protein